MTDFHEVISEERFRELQALDGCSIANAVEAFKVRLRNEGFAHGSLSCRFPHFPPMLGYAVTGTIRTAAPPMKGSCYYDRIDFWRYVLSVPPPRIIVLQDIDAMPGIGALVGEVHARIALALNCVGYVTNGSVRDVSAVEATGFHLFSGGISVSHAYAHIIEFGERVEICGLNVRPGDLIHGDSHGLQVIPASIAADIPATVETQVQRERELIEYCQSPVFSVDGLQERFDTMRAIQPCD